MSHISCGCDGILGLAFSPVRAGRDARTTPRGWILACKSGNLAKFSPDILTSRPTVKLEHKRLGPFQVTERISPVAYRLTLPPSMRIHDVFHASLLSAYFGPTGAQQLKELPMPEVVDGQEEYEINHLVDL